MKAIKRNSSVAIALAAGLCLVAQEARSIAADIPWLIVSEEQPWSLALAAPVAARMQQSGQQQPAQQQLAEVPLVMAVTSPPTREAEWLLTLSAPASGPTNESENRPIVLATSERT